MTTINYTLQIVLGTAAELAALNPVLLDGQLGKETDTNKFKVGNGTLPWGSIEYHITNNTLSVYLGASIEEHNLLGHSTEDGGLVLPKAALDTENIINDVLAGTLSLSDRITFALNDQHKLATLLLAVYTKRLAGVLGGDFLNVFQPGGYTGDTVMTMITALQTAVSNLSSVTSGLIDDGTPQLTKVWSSTKVASEIASASQALKNQLVGDAGEALDTIYELASALTNNTGYIATLLDEVSKGVKFTEQTLTLPQKDQARVNIDAAAGSLVGTYGEIGDVTLLSVLGAEAGDPEVVDEMTMTELTSAVLTLQVQTHMFNCSMYKSAFNANNGLFETTTWRRHDASLAATSILTGAVSGNGYLPTTRTETLYAGNGTTVLRTTVYDLTYDALNNLVSEVINSVT